MTPIVSFDPGFRPAERQTGGEAHGRPIYELLDDYPWQCAGRLHAVPRGFQYDYASVPRIGWTIIPPNDPDYAGPARIHDYLYETHIYSRSASDFIMLEGFRLMGVPAWQRAIMYGAVRAFGAKAWKHPRMSIDYWRDRGGYVRGPDPLYKDPRTA